MRAVDELLIAELEAAGPHGEDQGQVLVMCPPSVAHAAAFRIRSLLAELDSMLKQRSAADVRREEMRQERAEAIGARDHAQQGWDATIELLEAAGSDYQNALWVARKLAADHPDETIDGGFDQRTGEDYGDFNPWDDMITRLVEDPDIPFPDDDEIPGGNLSEYLDQLLRTPQADTTEEPA
ncbi:MAG: hypothetical protein AAGA90_24035 [Actinomycetota bacterium]